MERFYIETSDEIGPTEYDAFSTVEEARVCVRDILAVGFRYAVIVDRNEMVAVEMFGDVPADWR